MYRIEDWRLKILRKTSSIQVWVEDWRFSEKLLQSNPGLKMWSQTWIEEVFLRIFNLQSSIQTWIEEVFLRIFNLQSSIQTWIEEVFLRIFNLQSSIQTWIEEVFLRIFNLQSSIRHMQLIASSRYFEGNQKWQEKLQKCKNGGFWGGTRQIDRYMYTCMYVCMYVGIKMNRIFNADTNCNNYLHIHIHIYVYKMAPGSNQQPWFAILNSNFEMYSVRVRNVEVYKAQRQLRPIQLKISLVAIQDLHKSKI